MSDASESTPGQWRLPETMVGLNLLEIGWLSASVWSRLATDPRDRTARALFPKLKVAAVALGVEWYYGELPPLPEEG
jgi:hypothetical protein